MKVTIQYWNSSGSETMIDLRNYIEEGLKAQNLEVEYVYKKELTKIKFDEDVPEEYKERISNLISDLVADYKGVRI